MLYKEKAEGSEYLSIVYQYVFDPTYSLYLFMNEVQDNKLVGSYFEQDY
jgi:hypothetical protein